MRCPFCGSKMIYPQIQHQNFSTGKAVAGALVAGVVGAAAGFIGKDKKVYRCSACGSISENVMDLPTEININEAVSDAENGRGAASYLNLKQRFANIENVNIAENTQSNLQNDEYPVSTQTIQAESEDNSKSIKNSYFYGKYIVDSPVLVETVTIKTANNKDYLEPVVKNVSGKTIRSAYFDYTVFDDVGDKVSSSSFVYQGMSVNDIFPAKEIELNTDIAYKVSLVCTKAAFEDDSVYRAPDSMVEIDIEKQDKLTASAFPKYHYLRKLIKRKKAKIGEEQNIYQPIFGEEYVQCVCSSIFPNGEKCKKCGLDIEKISEIISFDALAEVQRETITKIAKQRYEKIEKVVEKGQETKYLRAQKLTVGDNSEELGSLIEAKEIFESLASYKDSTQKASECSEKISQIEEQIKKEQEEARILAEQKAKEEKERTEAEQKIRKKQNTKRVSIFSSIICVGIATIILLITVIIPNSKYNNAISLMNKGEYEEAKYIFYELDDYKDSVKKINECEVAIIEEKYKNAVTSMELGEYNDALSAFEDIKDYKDSQAKIKECNAAIVENKYNNAIALMNKGQYEQAYKAFQELGNYKESAKNAEKVRWEMTKHKLKNVKKGDIVEFGVYEQDNVNSNGKEQIIWKVLDVQGSKVLLISEYVLDYQDYHKEAQHISWSKCTLRKWLNNDFMNLAFSSSEKRIILPTRTSAVQDNVFLLSIEEFKKYFKEYSSDAKVKATDYALEQEFIRESGWWLRDIQKKDYESIYSDACYISNEGEIEYSGSSVFVEGGVRPAMWIDLSKI